jgi:predicted glutamine amidotransferase
VSRWLAYTGPPMILREGFDALGVSIGDDRAEAAGWQGCGIGWYGAGGAPVVYRSGGPSDPALRAVAGRVSSRLFFAHLRVSTGTAVQRTNCHPFRHGEWLWMHNGQINGFHELKRDLVLDIDPLLYPSIQGQTDSEVLFFLALTMGLEEAPPVGVARAVGVVEAAARRRRIEGAIRMTVATTNGESVWAFRYSSDGRSQTLLMSDDTGFIASGPPTGLPGAWRALPESNVAVASRGALEVLPFAPPRISRTHRPAHLGGSWPA